MGRACCGGSKVGGSKGVRVHELGDSRTGTAGCRGGKMGRVGYGGFRVVRWAGRKALGCVGRARVSMETQEWIRKK